MEQQPPVQPHSTDNELNAVLESLLSLVQHDENKKLAQQTSELIRRLAEQRFYLVVLGQFKRGKSTFINALLDLEILPTGALPVTSVITLIEYGAKRQISVSFKNGEEKRIYAGEIGEYVTERDNPHNKRNVDAVRIAVPSPLLQSGVVLVDTPGLGSTFTHNSDTTRKFVPQVDAGLILLGGSPPIGEEEMRFLDEIGPTVPKMIYIINKSDQLSTGERDEVLEFTRSVLSRVDPDPEIYLTAAIAPFKKISKDAQLDVDGGVGRLRERLSYLARAEALSLLKASLVRKGRRVATTFIDTLSVEMASVDKPVGQNEKKLQRFKKAYTRLARLRAEHEAILESDLEVVLAEIDWVLKGFLRRAVAPVQEEIRKTAQGIEEERKDELVDILSEERKSSSLKLLEQLRERAFSRAEKGYEESLIRYQKALEDILVSLKSATGQIFGFQPGDVDLDVSLPERSDLFFSLDDQPHFYEYEKVENWISARVMAYPVYREKVVEKALKQVEPLLDRNMGRVRADLVHRINEGARQFKHQVNQRVEEYKKNIEQAVARGMRIRAKTKKEREKQLENFRALIERTEQVVQALDRMG